MSTSGKIILQGLEVLCRIGVEEEERRQPRRLRIDVEATSDLRRQVADDKIDETGLDYSGLAALIREEASASEFHLLEALADHLASLSIANLPVKKIRIRILKPGAVPGLEAAGVELEKTAPGL